MTNVSKKLREISEIEFPDGLHGRIMRKLFFIRYRGNFLLVAFLLTANIFLSGWRFWARMDELDTISVIRALLEGFDVSRGFTLNFFSTLSQSFPVISVSIFIINILVITYVTYLYFKFKTFDALKVGSVN